MAARRYEVSLREYAEEYFTSEHSARVKYQHERKNFVSPSSHIMVYLLYNQQWNPKPLHLRCESRHLLCSYSNGDLFTCEDNMLFSLVKIS